MSRTILIVEDDETVAELLAFTFRKGGWDPSIVPDGRAAAAWVESRPPTDAVLLDVMLPCRDGYAVAAVIRQDPRWSAVPIVMVSGHPADEHAERAGSLRIQAFVAKPFRPLQLLKCVEDVLGREEAA